jgi:glycerol-3-phosphate cytidylyltransferase
MVKAVRWVDEVRLYDTESDLYDLLEEIEPDVRIVGADWQSKQFTGCELPIKIYFNSRDHGWSTSDLRDRVYRAELIKRQQRQGD